MILPSWFPSRSDGSTRLRLLSQAADEAVDPASVRPPPEAEWLGTNQKGSFAMGTIDRRPRRKYHSLLTVREPGVGDPLNLIAELEEWFIVGDQRVALHSYDWGDAVEPNGVEHLVDFDPQPRWTYGFEGLTVTRELWLEDTEDAVWIRYAIQGLREPVSLNLRPLIRYRPLHKLTFANPFLDGEVQVTRNGSLQVEMEPYEGVPSLVASLHGADGAFRADGHWYEGVHYEWERERGYDDAEDLFTPGEFQLTIEKDGALSVRLGTSSAPTPEPQVLVSMQGTTTSFVEELDAAADAFLVKLHGQRTGVIAGYPWFGEWSRDALISLPGLCLARNRVDEALAILESLADRMEGGLIPNIPQSGDVPANGNAIDASLLFVWATALVAKRSRSRRVTALQDHCLTLCANILDGADPRVRIDRQGFLVVERGPWALTWMDALVEGVPVTPRWGYAVDLNALWLSGLGAAARWAKKLRPKLLPKIEETARKLSEHFEEKFWLQDAGFLTDTHDGRNPDRKLRPNQLWALVLPGIPIDLAHKRRALQTVRQHLVTPVGLRTLAPDDPDYQPFYRGEQAARDRAYHQGTVWPWLIGLYADAVVGIEGEEALKEELLPILAAMCTHLRIEGCVGQIGEVFDGKAPHRPGGAPAQAWSVAEVLRVAKMAIP